MAGKSIDYRIFVSESYDWYVAAKRTAAEPQLLYEGHDLEKAYELVLKDMGIKIPILERDMESGTYEPVREDF
jgi:hypothetical protein